ncbi:FG-GAP repeat domain-containing protein [Streptomyces sp. SS]|uniref:FG-GAP repeat domain-containing protein n=1 Tax=Streptomyces sp. SS TaxID=260742 RepID=UPI000379414E|nr:VCBS repeat-containing protein [Streptomyces sp. SS]
MIHARTSRRRLAAAVAAVLVVTAGTLATPAIAAAPGASPVAAATTTEQVPAQYPAGAVLISAGPTGFVTGASGPTQVTYRWTRYSDGATTVFPGRIGAAAGTDIIRTEEGTTHKLYDMATGADPVVIDIGGPLASYTRRSTVGSTFAMSAPNATGGTDLHLVDNPDGTVRDRTVPGLPPDAVLDAVSVVSSDTLVVQYSGTVDGAPHRRVALVDVASGMITRNRESPAPGGLSGLKVTDTHLAWVEKPTTSTLAIAVARWDDAPATEPEHIPVGSGTSLVIDLVGDWVTYTTPGGIPLTARSLRTGETVKLLDHVISSRIGPGGTQAVRGGSLAEGEGLYRVSVGESGTPEAKFLATTGESTAAAIVSDDVPAVIDLNQSGGTATFHWALNRSSIVSGIELTHVASGRKWTPERYSGTNRTVSWNGTFTNGVAAYNGEYTWRITGTPRNGIGPAAERTGRFTLVNAPAPHDYSDSGTPDVLVRDNQGRLVSYDVRQVFWPIPFAPAPETTQLGNGWQIFDRLVAPGNLGGSPHADVIARDRNGLLWLYPGTGRALGARVNVGTGWQIYDKIAGGSDLTNDGKPDLLATDKTGGLWLYPATGNVNAPFGARKKIGTGWGIYHQITATGNLGGAPAGDLVALDKDGLWVYYGKGDGTFAPRAKLGLNWNWGAFKSFIGVGDADRDGRNDLLGVTISGGSYLLSGTGDWRQPFEEDSDYGWGISEGTEVAF